MDTQAQHFLRNKTVVVFGAGYVGGHLAVECLNAGACVTVLTRNSQTGQKLESLGAKIICADLATDSWHDKIEHDIDFCLNCVSAGGGGLESYRRSYVEGMNSVGQWLQYSRVSTITYTSSTSVYAQNGGERIDETAPLVVPGLDEAASCLCEAERILREQAKHVHQWYILRLAGIYGPGRHHLLDQLRQGELIFQGSAERHINLIHRDDITQAILDLWTASTRIVSNPMLNVVDDGEATRGEVIAWLARRLGLPVPTFTGQMSERRLQTPADRIISNSRIKAEIGWRPSFPSYREGYEAILSVG